MDEKENKTERVQLLMTPSEVSEIDEWGFSHRIRTRAETIRRMCQIAMYVEKHIPGLLAASNAVAGDVVEASIKYEEETGKGPKASDEILRLHDLTYQTQVIFQIVDRLQKGQTLEEAMKQADEVVAKHKAYLDRAKAWEKD